MKTFAAALILMLGLLFAGVPAAYAHSIEPMESCYKTGTQVQADSVGFVKADKKEAQVPCHENCPSGGKMAKGGCCMTSCASLSFTHYGHTVKAVAMPNGQVLSPLASAFASITPSGPQKPPRLS